MKFFYNEIYKISDNKFGSLEKGFFILHNGNGYFDIYDKKSGNWYKGYIKFPFCLFKKFYIYPKIYFLHITKIYKDHKYLELCKYCKKKYIIPLRIDKCNECYNQLIENDIDIINIYTKKYNIELN